VDMVYMAFDVPEDRLAAAVSGLRALGAAGANVTVPHKEKVVPLLDDVDSAARRIGAVNTIVNEGGALIGHNTDVHGFLVALERGWGRTPRGSRCLVLGAGGAARAVVAGLGAADAAEIWVYNRTAVRARDLCAEARGWSLVPCRPVADAELGFVSAQVDVIVNATSVGMGDTVKLSPVPVDMVKEHHVVVDLVYGPEPTALLRHTRAVGGVALDGLEMLLQQAARSYELWTGRTAPIEFMRRLATDG
jgi:shikimate dehydrogenase